MEMDNTSFGIRAKYYESKGQNFQIVTVVQRGTVRDAEPTTNQSIIYFSSVLPLFSGSFSSLTTDRTTSSLCSSLVEGRGRRSNFSVVKSNLRPQEELFCLSLIKLNVGVFNEPYGRGVLWFEATRKCFRHCKGLEVTNTLVNYDSSGFREKVPGPD
ncbi:hypothetical protein F2Q70_00037078 [Brassica cretica]|uniref:Uncharacterized protein n=1 Tax=Brassica cretica TaxID=69181 RepID=A0A8S9JZD1_BRACR|nr:hypothetical protein F2Q70_00037078 [Brassica cretica]